MISVKISDDIPPQINISIVYCRIYYQTFLCYPIRCLITIAYCIKILVIGSILKVHIYLISRLICNSYTIGCPPVRGDNPRALASGLSNVQAYNHGISILYHLHQCIPCTSQDILCSS